MNKDPVKHCVVYKTEGCSHVDGMLCDYETCDIRLKYLEELKRFDWGEAVKKINGPEERS